MDFLGIGPFELLVVFLLAFLFFGPEKVPGIAVKLGQYYRKLTRAATEVTRTINTELAEEERKISEVKPPDSPDKNTPSVSNPESSQPKTPGQERQSDG